MLLKSNKQNADCYNNINKLMDDLTTEIEKLNNLIDDLHITYIKKLYFKNNIYNKEKELKK